jgi:dethiobiotin synthetase
MKGLFVTGTDTGVGKTQVACTLATTFAHRGIRVGVMKPCETGGGDDHRRLIAASGRALNEKLVCPYRFPAPVAPEVAARQAGKSIEIRCIERAFSRLQHDSDLMIVEGAGGLLVPLTRALLMADLADRLKLPVLIVARPTLGTINHTLLTVEAARHRGLTVLGVVFSRQSRVRDASDATNLETIARHGNVRVFGMLPWMSEKKRRASRDLDQIAHDHLHIELLWKSLSQEKEK